MTRLAWGARVPEWFRDKVVSIAAAGGFDPSWPMACIKFESNFNPEARNPNSSASGLIQFMEFTAPDLGTTIEAIRGMSSMEQLDLVEKYFTPFYGRIHSLSDCYMAILKQTAVGLPDDAIIFPAGSRGFLVNKGLDLNHDGDVTKAEAAQFVARALEDGMQPGNVYAVEDTQPAAPIDDRSEPLPQPEKPMGALALLQLFGPILSTMIPQIGALLKPGSKAAGYAGIAQTVLDTITTTAKSTNLQGAIEAMQSDPAVRQAVQQAVVTHPEIIGVLEIGGGIPAARAANLAVQNADKPFWFSPAIWVSLALLPLVYWIVGGVLVGGIEISAEAPWYLQSLKIFGTSFNAETRSGTVNLVLGMVLGGIVGMYFGTSYGSMRKTELAAQATADDKPNQ
jgi:hypothetical protein